MSLKSNSSSTASSAPAPPPPPSPPVGAGKSGRRGSGAVRTLPLSRPSSHSEINSCRGKRKENNRFGKMRSVGGGGGGEQWQGSLPLGRRSSHSGVESCKCDVTWGTHPCSVRQAGVCRLGGASSAAAGPQEGTPPASGPPGHRDCALREGQAHVPCRPRPQRKHTQQGGHQTHTKHKAPPLQTGPSWWPPAPSWSPPPPAPAPAPPPAPGPRQRRRRRSRRRPPGTSRSAGAGRSGLQGGWVWVWVGGCVVVVGGGGRPRGGEVGAQ